MTNSIPTGTQPPTPSDLRDLAVEIAAEAAELATSRRGAIRRLDTKSSASDMVTDVDTACEELIVSRLAQARPDDGVVGEEGTGITGTSGIDWVIDPIDGTTSFVYGYPGWSISIAASIDGQTAAGAVADPTHDEVFAAAAGEGATCNGATIQTNVITHLPSALVSTGFSYLPQVRANQARVLAGMLPQIRDIRRIGSAALELCMTACGRADAYFEVGLNPWDIGAGLLIASEAGAVTLTESPEGRHSFTVASAPGIAAELNKLLEAAGARTV